MDLSELVRRALEEDVGGRDLTSVATVPEERAARGVFLAKQELVVSGLDVAAEVFRAVDERLAFEPLVAEGRKVPRGTHLARVSGKARGILMGERVALNFVQRMSGVATLTRRFVDVVAGTGARIRDTRKTTPLLRALEKRAVEAGGGVSHRAGLDKGILIKDNHARLAGTVGEATRRARAAFPDVTVEVEVEELEQIEEAISAGAQMILLDNFTPAGVRQAVAAVRGRVPVEVSGGVTLLTVRGYAEAGADYVAVGALTHSAPAADVSLEIEPG
ncbi:MAG TPA: carboxylating nicotinate-nucleotide diphosphorylase [Vicinamibacteria bacterium]|nr:carboxylating nicotinate-nucleotide diphosphorylase [Vicinamibacteria bacterium]